MLFCIYGLTTYTLHIWLDFYLGGAGNENWLPSTHANAADICRMEAINVLVNADGIEDAALVDMLGQGQLDEDAVDLGVGIVGLYNLIVRQAGKKKVSNSVGGG